MVDVDIDTDRAGPAVLLGSLLFVILVVVLMFTLLAGLGVLIGYGLTELLNGILGWSLNPRYGALIGCIVALLANETTIDDE